MVTKKFFLLLISSALVLRIILSAVTFHYDIVHFAVASHVLGLGKVLDFYDYSFNAKEDVLFSKKFPKELFNYPPAVYFTLGAINLFTTLPFDNGFKQDFLFDFDNLLGSTQLMLYLVVLKLPLLLFDFLVGLLLFCFFDTKKQKIVALIIWAYNPVSLYSIYMMGQFDIIPTFFVMLSLFTSLKAKEGNGNKNLLLSSFYLGLGVSFKLFPILLLIPLVASVKKWGLRVQMVLICFMPYFLSILPFLSSEGYRKVALVANQTTKSFYGQLNVSGGESIIVFLAALIFTYMVFLNIFPDIVNLWQRYLIIFLLFFIFTHYHPQWLLWLLPLFIIEAVYSNFKHWYVYLMMLISYIVLIFLFEPGLNVGIFSPVYPPLNNFDSIWQIFNIKIDVNFTRSFFHTIFAGGAFYLIYQYFPKKYEN